MYRDVSGITLNFLGHVHDSFGIGITFIKFFEIRALLHRPLKCHGESLCSYRYELGNLVTESVREAERSSNVTHCAAGHHSAEGANLGHVVCAVLTSGIFDELISSVVCN